MSFSTYETNEILVQLIPKDYKIFIEQQHFKKINWEETARWIEFEENVECGSNKWSKPYVPVVSFVTMQKISESITYGYVIQDIECNTYVELVNQLIANLLREGRMNQIDVQVLNDTLLLPHVHQSSLTNKSNKKFENKLPNNLEAACILTGEIKGLVKPICVFVRLKKGNFLHELVEVHLPVKFLFIYLTHNDSEPSSEDIGKGFGTLMTDENFVKFCYEESNLYRVTTEIEAYLTKCSILPPGYDNTVRLSPEIVTDMENPFKEIDSFELHTEENYQFRENSGLVRSGKCFGGFVKDFHRKAPFYLSDFQDILSTQIISSTLFLYFAYLTTLITGAKLLGHGTDHHISINESIIGATINGIFYALFSAQPLSLLCITGPLIIYDSLIYELCLALEWDFMTFRFWIGIWLSVLLLTLTATDSSALISYVTRFTQEVFILVLCTVLLLTTPTQYLIRFGEKYFFKFLTYDYGNATYCNEVNTNNSSSSGLDINSIDCVDLTEYDPESFLMSVLLTIFTCGSILFLSNFKLTSFFAFKLRCLISDFAVFISVILFCIIDFFMGLNTEKLIIPDRFDSTLAKRGWWILPYHEKNPWYSVFAAIIPAIVATFLIFLNNQISISIVCRKENQLRKGVGYHFDLFLISILTLVNSVFSLPWFSVSIVLSLAHLEALKLETSSICPGAKTKFVGFNEQRLTHLLVALLIGVSIFFAPILKYVPISVLYGVFLFMGIQLTKNLQFVHRIGLFFMSAKYMPDYLFLRRAPLNRIHLFTLAQIGALILLCGMNSFKETTLLFPICLVVIILTRRALDYYFKQEELRVLDDVLPQTTKRRRGVSYIVKNRVPTTVRRKVMVF